LIVFVKDTAKTNTSTIEAMWKHKIIARSAQQEECLPENTVVFHEFM